VQIDEANPFLQGDGGGSSPNTPYDIITMPGWTPDIRRQDYLIDELNLDVNTGVSAKYLVNGRPELFQFSHLEIKAELIEGQ